MARVRREEGGGDGPPAVLDAGGSARRLPRLRARFATAGGGDGDAERDGGSAFFLFAGAMRGGSRGGAVLARARGVATEGNERRDSRRSVAPKVARSRRRRRAGRRGLNRGGKRSLLRDTPGSRGGDARRRQSRSRARRRSEEKKRRQLVESFARKAQRRILGDSSPRVVRKARRFGLNARVRERMTANARDASARGARARPAPTPPGGRGSGVTFRTPTLTWQRLRGICQSGGWRTHLGLVRTRGSRLASAPEVSEAIRTRASARGGSFAGGSARARAWVCAESGKISHKKRPPCPCRRKSWAGKFVIFSSQRNLPSPSVLMPRIRASMRKRRWSARRVFSPANDVHERLAQHVRPESAGARHPSSGARRRTRGRFSPTRAMPRVFLSPSTNYERRMLEDAFDRCARRRDEAWAPLPGKSRSRGPLRGSRALLVP